MSRKITKPAPATVELTSTANDPAHLPKFKEGETVMVSPRHSFSQYTDPIPAFPAVITCVSPVGVNGHSFYYWTKAVGSPDNTLPDITFESYIRALEPGDMGRALAS